MPSRVLRADILDSRRVGRLSEGAQLLYYKLLSLVDDYGRFHADPELLIIKAFPWKQSDYTPREILLRLHECASGDEPLLTLYAVGSKSYLELQDDQRKPLAVKSKFPGPKDPDGLRRTPTESVGRVGSSPLTNTNTNTDSKTNLPEGGVGGTVPVPHKAPTPIRPPVAELTDEEWNVTSADDVARKLVAMIHPNHPEPCYADSAIIECGRALIEEVPEPLWEETAKRWRENHALQVSIWEEKRAKSPGIYVPRLDEWFTKRMCNQRPKARDSPASANDIARQQALARQAAKIQAEAGL